METWCSSSSLTEKKNEEERDSWQISDFNSVCGQYYLSITELTENYRNYIFLDIPETSLLSGMSFGRDF